MCTICCKILKLCILTKHCTCISKQSHNLTQFVAINSINRFEFLMDADCVLCEVGTDFLRTIQMNVSLHWNSSAFLPSSDTASNVNYRVYSGKLTRSSSSIRKNAKIPTSKTTGKTITISQNCFCDCYVTYRQLILPFNTSLVPNDCQSYKSKIVNVSGTEKRCNRLVHFSHLYRYLSNQF